MNVQDMAREGLETFAEREASLVLDAVRCVRDITKVLAEPPGFVLTAELLPPLEAFKERVQEGPAAIEYGEE